MAQTHSDHWTVRACDLPGHGKSDDWDGSSDLFEFCLSKLASSMNAPMDVIGHSFGAVVALGLAQKHPDRIRRLCLFEPVLFAASALDDPKPLADYKAQTVSIDDALSRQDWKTAARLFNRIWGDGGRWDDVPAHTQGYIIQRMPLIAAQERPLNNDTFGLLAPQRLARVTMPVLLMYGSESPPVTRAIVDALAARMEHPRLEELPGAGHMAPITHPKEVGRAFFRFLEEA